MKFKEKSIGLVAIRERKSGKYVNLKAFELWEAGHITFDIDFWTDDINQAAWITLDELPSGIDKEKFELVTAAEVEVL